MIFSDILALIIVYVYVAVIFVIAEMVLKTRPEVSRKFLHIMVGNMIFAMPFFADPWTMVWFLTLPITIGLFFLTEYSPIKIENSVTESGHALGLFFYALIWTILNSGIVHPIDAKTIHTNTLITVVTTNIVRDPSRDLVPPNTVYLTFPNF